MQKEALIEIITASLDKQLSAEIAYCGKEIIICFGPVYPNDIVVSNRNEGKVKEFDRRDLDKAVQLFLDMIANFHI